jgi:hypothetical protein
VGDGGSGAWQVAIDLPVSHALTAVVIAAIRRTGSRSSQPDIQLSPGVTYAKKPECRCEVDEGVSARVGFTCKLIEEKSRRRSGFLPAQD